MLFKQYLLFTMSEGNFTFSSLWFLLFVNVSSRLKLNKMRVPLPFSLSKLSPRVTRAHFVWCRIIGKYYYQGNTSLGVQFSLCSFTCNASEYFCNSAICSSLICVVRFLRLMLSNIVNILHLVSCFYHFFERLAFAFPKRLQRRLNMVWNSLLILPLNIPWIGMNQVKIGILHFHHIAHGMLDIKLFSLLCW